MAGFWALNQWPWPGGGPHFWNLKLATSRLAHDVEVQKEHISSHPPEDGEAVSGRGWWALTHFFLNLCGFEPGFCQEHTTTTTTTMAL